MGRTLFQFTGSLAMTLPLTMQAQTPARTPLTAARIASALTGTGLRVDENRIDLPISLSTTGNDPILHVTGAELLPDGRIRVRMACRQAGDCQPFLFAIQSPSEPERMAIFAGLQKNLQLQQEPRPQALKGRVLAGQHTTLLLEDDHMRITVPVLVIDSGAPGAEVRVSSLDRKQVFRAVVADDAGTVRGTLP